MRTSLLAALLLAGCAASPESITTTPQPAVTDDSAHFHNLRIGRVQHDLMIEARAILAFDPVASLRLLESVLKSTIQGDVPAFIKPRSEIDFNTRALDDFRTAILTPGVFNWTRLPPENAKFLAKQLREYGDILRFDVVNALDLANYQLDAHGRSLNVRLGIAPTSATANASQAMVQSLATILSDERRLMACLGLVSAVVASDLELMADGQTEDLTMYESHVSWLRMGMSFNGQYCSTLISMYDKDKFLERKHCDKTASGSREWFRVAVNSYRSGISDAAHATAKAKTPQDLMDAANAVTGQVLQAARLLGLGIKAASSCK